MKCSLVTDSVFSNADANKDFDETRFLKTYFDKNWKGASPSQHRVQVSQSYW